jgi:hypothetical protein
MILSFDIEKQDLSLQLGDELQIISFELVKFGTMQKEVLMDGIKIGDATLALRSFVGS